MIEIMFQTHSRINYKKSVSALFLSIIFIQSCGSPRAKLHCESLPHASAHAHSYQGNFLAHQAQPSLSPSHYTFATAPSGVDLSMGPHAVSERLSNSYLVLQPTSAAISNEAVVSRCVVDSVFGPVSGKAAPTGAQRCSQPVDILAPSIFLSQEPTTIRGPFNLSLGLTVMFSRVGGQWLAEVKDDFLMRKETLPVICKGDVSSVLSDLQGARNIDVLHRIHIIESGQCIKHVCVGALGGVRGGGRSKGKRKKRNENIAKRQRESTAVEDCLAQRAHHKTSDNTSLIEDSLAHSVANLSLSSRETQSMYVYSILAMLDKLRDYLTDKKARLEIALSSFSPSDVYRERKQRAFQINQKAIDNLYGQFCSLSRGDMTKDDCLACLLNLRANYLASRDLEIKRWLNDGLDNDELSLPSTPFIVPTDEVLFSLMCKTDKEKIAEINEMNKKESLFLYETFTLLTKELCRLCTRDELSQETIKLLTQSRSLWPRIQEETKAVDRLGHPDEFTLYNAFSTIIQRSKSIGSKKSALALLEDIILPENYKDACKVYQVLRGDVGGRVIGSGKALIKTIHICATRQWLKDYVVDVFNDCLIKQDFISKEAFTPLTVSDNQASDECESYISLEDIANMTDNEAFSDKMKDNLKKYIALCPKPDLLSAETGDVPWEMSEEDRFFYHHKLTSSSVAQNIDKHVSNVDSHQLGQATVSPKTFATEQQLSSDTIHTNQPKTLENSIEINPSLSTNDIIEVLYEKVPSLDKLLRDFVSKIEAGSSKHMLSSKHYDLLKSLCCAETQQKTVAYDAYINLCKRLGGELSTKKGGGSHLKIVKNNNKHQAPDKTCLVAGIFRPHDNCNDYGINYARKHLVWPLLWLLLDDPAKREIIMPDSQYTYIPQGDGY